MAHAAGERARSAESVIAALELAARRTRISSDRNVMRQAIRHIREQDMSEERIKDLEAQVAHERQIAGFLRDARNAEITRLRELELALEKAEADKLAAVRRAIEAAAGCAQPAASGAVDSQPSPTLPNTWHWVAEQEGVEYVEYHHGYQAPPYAVDVWEPLFTADQMREYARAAVELNRRADSAEIAALRHLRDEVANLLAVKGRHHTEQAYQRVQAAFATLAAAPAAQPDKARKPVAWLVEWPSAAGVEKWVIAHASELPAIYQARCMNGTVTPLFAAPPAPAAQYDWRDAIMGKTVSMDVSTDENDVGHRIFGTIYEVIKDSDDTILAVEESRNFATPAAQPEGLPVDLIERIRKACTRLGIASGESLEACCANPESLLYPMCSAVDRLFDRAAPAAQPADAETLGQFESLDRENHRLRRGMQKLMERLAMLLDEHHFSDCESIVEAAGVKPPAEHQSEKTDETGIKHTRPDDQGAPENARHDPAAVSGQNRVLADHGHEHRAGQSDPDRADGDGDRQCDGISGAGAVREDSVTGTPAAQPDHVGEANEMMRAQAVCARCDTAFDNWYAAQRHQLTNEQVCRVIWTRGWEARGADNPEMDGTDAAHPAWWRSHDHTFAVMCEKLEKLLDGEPVVGATEPRWQRIRKRIAALVAAQPVGTMWCKVCETERAENPCKLCGTMLVQKASAQPAAPQGQRAGFFRRASEFGPWLECEATENDAVPLYTAPPAPSAPSCWISVKDRLPAPGQRIHGLSDAHAWIETFDPREPFGRMTHWKPHEETPESAPSAGEQP